MGRISVTHTKSVGRMAERMTAVALAVALAVMAGCGKSDESLRPALRCHVGGTMRPVMLELAKVYEAETGQAVEINSAGSGELLVHLDLHKEGDLYVCHDPFMDILMKKYRMGVDGWTIAELTPVIVVRKGNPKKITGLADLLRDDVDLALTDYKDSTLGRMLPTIFAKVGIDFAKVNRDKQIQTNRSGGIVANLVKMDNADAAMVWDAVAYLRRSALDVVPIGPAHLPTPGVDTVTSATGKAYPLTPVRVTIATLTCAKQPEAARAFAEFVVSDRGRKIIESFGFTMSPAVKHYEGGRPAASHAAASDDASSDKGPVKLYAGAGLRPALQELIATFKKQTGITVEADYSGSGMAISRARLDDEADLFMPGDVSYVDRLQELTGKVESQTAISWFVPVIIVRKGNPKKITSLKDFLRNDVTVGLGRADVCRVGRISGKILGLSGVDRSKLDATESLTVNELGVWVKMGSVDAAIVWDAIAANFADAVDVIEIPRRKNVISRVVVGRLKTSQHPAAARRFVEFLVSDEGRRILARRGYRVEAP
jgi:molybdate transport system substrate-binding protein